jgi:hypothetical protein
MKYRLKDVDFSKIKYSSSSELEHGSIINIIYNGEILEFQTPRMIIDSIFENNGKNYFSLKLIPTEASKIFYLKIFELEQILMDSFKGVSNYSFKDDALIVKIPFCYSKPNIKVYIKEAGNLSLFNYYQLEPGMEVICLLYLDKLWKNGEKLNYVLNTKELLITKKK